jgi:hypothetical protein
MSARDRILVGIAGSVAVVAALWFMAISPRFHDAKTLSTQVAKAQERRVQAEGDLAQAQAAVAGYRSNYATVARLGKSVPVDDEVPSLVYQLDAAANATGIDFRSIKLAAGAAGAPADTSTPAPSGKSGSATQTVAATLPPGASIGPAGFPSMPFSFAFEGSFFTLERFLRKIDAFTGISGKRIRVGGRLLTLNGISLTAAPEGFPHIRASISATAFLVPADQGLTAGATAASPTAVSTPSGSAAITATPTAGGTP